MEIMKVGDKEYFIDIFKNPIEVGDILYKIQYSNAIPTICLKITKTTIIVADKTSKWENGVYTLITKERRSGKWDKYINCTKLGKSNVGELIPEYIEFYQKNYLKSS